LKNSILISENTSVKEAMRIIYKNDLGMVIVENDQNEFISLLTSGDIRRSILKGFDVFDPIKSILKEDVLTLTEEKINDEKYIQNFLMEANKRKAQFIPVLDDKKKIKYVVPVSDLINGEKKQEALKFKRKVLIIGGAGYLGLVLVDKLLDKGYFVRVLDNLLFGENHLPLSHKNLEFMKGDMRNITHIIDALKGIDSVILLAGIVGDPASKSLPQDTIEVNYLATKVVAEACKYNQINRFIFASTCSVYGVGSKILDEDSSLNPLSFYAKSKIISEEGILGLMDENFSPCILRMGTLYGFSKRMRFDLVLNILTAHALKKGKMTVFGGQQYRPLLHIEDAAEVYIKCLEAPLYKIKGQIFNVGSDKQNYKIIDLANEINSFIPGSTVEVLKDDVDNRDYCVSFDKLNKILDFEVSKTVKDAVLEIKESFDKGIIENYEDRKYRNA